MSEGMGRLFFSLFLLLAAASDLRWKQIPIWQFVLFGLCGLCVFCGEKPESYALFRLLPGLCSLLITLFGKGAVGAGDGIFFLTAACYLDTEEIWILWIGGLICSSLAGLCLIVKEQRRGRSGRTLRLPFLPFLVPVWLFLNLPF